VTFDSIMYLRCLTFELQNSELQLKYAMIDNCDLLDLIVLDEFDDFSIKYDQLFVANMYFMITSIFLRDNSRLDITGNSNGSKLRAWCIE